MDTSKRTLRDWVRYYKADKGYIEPSDRSILLTMTQGAQYGYKFFKMDNQNIYGSTDKYLWFRINY